MSIVLFGSTEITYSIANFLKENKYQLSAVVTIPKSFTISYSDNKVNNSRYIDISAWAKENHIPVLQYKNSNQILSELQQLKLNNSFAIVAGWYHMLPKNLRAFFSLGCAGFHASLLPKLRGGAPLNWAILLGHSQTGVSLFELSDGVDDGNIYDQVEFIISKDDYIEDLITKANLAILKILSRSLAKIMTHDIIPTKQAGNISYCGQRAPHDSQISWHKKAYEILLLIRASSKPYSGAYSFLDNNKIEIWRAQEATGEIYGSPGQIFIIDNTVNVACQDGAIEITDASSLSQLIASNQKRFTNQTLLT